jgi:hypothetical protein
VSLLLLFGGGGGGSGPPLIPFPIFDDFEIGVNVKWDGSTWTDVTEDLRELIIRYPSRSRMQAVYQAGTLSMTLDNRDRKYDPLHAGGAHFGELKVNKEVRVRFATSGGLATAVWSGWIDGFAFAYDKSNNDATATITAVDALGKAAVSSIPAGFFPSLAAVNYIADRGQDLVDAAGSTGITFDAATGYARFGNVWDATRRHNLLEELRRNAELECGPLIVDSDGTLYQEARYWFATRPESVSSNATIPSASLPCSDIRVVFDSRELVSAVSMTSDLGEVATATNATAVADFGERYAELSFNSVPAADLGSLQGSADTWVGVRGGEEFRFDAVRIQPQRSSDWWEHIQDRRILDRVTVTFTPTGIGDPITQDAFIDGIEHRITPDTFDTTWHLLPAALFAAYDFFVLDSSVLDGTDVLGY